MEEGGEEASQVRRVSGSSGKESETSINSDFGGDGPWTLVSSCSTPRPPPLGGGGGGRRGEGGKKNFVELKIEKSCRSFE